MIRRTIIRNVLRVRPQLSEAWGIARQGALEVHADHLTSPSGKQALLDQLAAEYDGLVAEMLGTLEDNLERARGDAEQAMTAAQSVTDERLAAKAAILGPVIAASQRDPDVLIRAYRDRVADPAARRVLEDAADTARLLMAEDDVAGFELRWNQARQEVRDQLPAAEREAAIGADELAPFGNYVRALKLMQRTIDSISHPVRSTDDADLLHTPVADLDRFEAANADLLPA